MLEHGGSGYLEQNIGPRLYAITFTVLGLAVFVFFLRVYCRLAVFWPKTMIASDVLVAVAMALDVGMCLMIHMQIHTGMGRHVEYSQAHPAMFRESMKVGLAENSLYQAAIPVVKSSILAQLLPLAMRGVEKKVLIGIWIFVTVFGLFTTFAAVFQCIPISAAWNLASFPQGCWNMMAVNLSTSAVNTLVDVVIFILPLPGLIGLHLSRKRKGTMTDATLLASFSFGSVAIACSIVRLRNMVLFNGIGDFTFVAAMVPVWDAVEINSGIICASIPTLAPLITRRRSSNQQTPQSGVPHTTDVENQERNASCPVVQELNCIDTGSDSTETLRKESSVV